MGRRVYAGFIVVLVGAMLHGLKPERVERLRQELLIDRRTLERWRQWWLVDICWEFVLERGPRPVHASFVRANAALFAVRQLRY